VPLPITRISAAAAITTPSQAGLRYFQLLIRTSSLGFLRAARKL
jgi:hypothetical protein